MKRSSLQWWLRGWGVVVAAVAAEIASEVGDIKRARAGCNVLAPLVACHVRHSA